MTGTWDDLRLALRRLETDDRRPLRQWPMPDSEQRPPFEVGLAAWATDVAEELRQRFGDDIRLTVGALRYPERILERPAIAPRVPEPADMDPARITVRLDGPLAVRSGHQAEHGLLVTNLIDRPAGVQTSGTHLLPRVVDPAGDQVVGGYSGLVFTIRKVFTVPPGGTATVPMLVSTDSIRPDLGYAVPPGEWGLRAVLAPDLGRTPVLPFTIT